MEDVHSWKTGMGYVRRGREEERRRDFYDGGKKKCHVRTMMDSETGENLKMNGHHVPFRKSVEETRLRKE